MAQDNIRLPDKDTGLSWRALVRRAGMFLLPSFMSAYIKGVVELNSRNLQDILKASCPLTRGTVSVRVLVTMAYHAWDGQARMTIS